MSAVRELGGLSTADKVGRRFNRCGRPNFLLQKN